MRHRGIGRVLSSFATIALAGCQPEEAHWSAPVTKSADQRPTQFGVSTKARLALSDTKSSGQAAGGAPSARRFVAQDPPAVWDPQPPQPSMFKDLVWRIVSDPATECYLTAQVGGGVTGNLARWYGQFGVKEVPAVESMPVFELAGRPGRLIELSGNYKGTNPGFAMILGFASDGDSLATLKFTGPEATVKAHRESFLALAKSLRSASGSADPKAPPIERGQTMPPGHPPVPGVEPNAGPHGTVPAATEGPFAATVPTGWQAKAGSSKALHHTFGSEGEVYVWQIGSGLKSNVDMWRNEMGLGATDDAGIAALPKVPMLGGDAVMLDLQGDLRSMSGKQIAGARMLLAAQESGGSIVFVKLVGKADEVEAQRAGFLAFCASLRRTQ